MTAPLSLPDPSAPTPPIDDERRAFFRTALGAAAVTATGAAALTIGARVAAQTVADSATLNFALQVEYLLAQFYNFAAFGSGLPAAQITGTGTAGSATGARQASLTDPVVSAFAREIAADKAAHVAFLRTALGTDATAQPAIDLGTAATGAFSTAMRAAGVVGAGASFDPYASDGNFLLAAFLFEDVVVTALRGASTVITSKANLEAAAGLLATTAYHAAIIRTSLYTLDSAATPLRAQADAISNVRDQLDGTADLDQGISPVTTNGGLVSNIVPLGADGIAFARSTGQTLNILFLNSAQVTRGGFYPAGVNGTVTTSAAN